MRKVFNKLVRDRIPEILEKKGIRFKSARVQKMERALLRKLREEIEELVSSKSSTRVEELADVYEVIEALAHHWNIRMQQVRKIQKKKRRVKGGFKEGILLFWTDESKK